MTISKVIVRLTLAECSFQQEIKLTVELAQPTEGCLVMSIVGQFRTALDLYKSLGSEAYWLVVIFSVDKTKAVLSGLHFRSRLARSIEVMPAEQPMPALDCHLDISHRFNLYLGLASPLLVHLSISS